MRFLADESCDFRVVSALRDADNDVIAIPELEPGATDVRSFSWRAKSNEPFLPKIMTSGGWYSRQISTHLRELYCSAARNRLARLCPRRSSRWSIV